MLSLLFFIFLWSFNPSAAVLSARIRPYSSFFLAGGFFAVFEALFNFFPESFSLSFFALCLFFPCFVNAFGLSRLRELVFFN